MDQYQKQLKRQEIRSIRKAIKQKIEILNNTINPADYEKQEKHLQNLKRFEKQLIKNDIHTPTTISKLEEYMKFIKRSEGGITKLIEENKKVINWCKNEITKLNILSSA